MCSKLLTARSSECNVWFEVARQNVNPTVRRLRSQTGRVPHRLLELKDSSDKIKSIIVTEDDNDAQAENSAEFRAFKNVRIERTKAQTREGTFEVRHVVKVRAEKAIQRQSRTVTRARGPFLTKVEGRLEVFTMRCYCYWGLWYPAKLDYDDSKISKSLARLLIQCSTCKEWNCGGCMKMFIECDKCFCARCWRTLI